MFVNVKKVLLPAVVLAVSATVYTAPQATAGEFKAAPQTGATKKICGKRGCFWIKKGKWYYQKHKK